jgi:predicted RNA-binding Zn-ribbon protein involved in translation (DUF1610 family)
MTISVVCPVCGTKLRAPGASAGKRLKCPECGEIVAVPGASVQTHATPVAKVEESAPRPAVRPTSPQSQSALTCPTCRTQIRPDPSATSAYCPQCWELVALPSTPTVLPVARPKKRKPLPSWLLPVGCPAAILGLALAFVGMGGCPARRQAADPGSPAPVLPPQLSPEPTNTPFGLPEVPRRPFAFGTWNIHHRPKWVGEWAIHDELDGKLNDTIEGLIQRRILISISALPNVVVLTDSEWAGHSQSEWAELAKGFSMFMYLHGFGDDLEIRAAGPLDFQGKLLATYSKSRGLVPIHSP